jgi:hypothetical protein
VELYLYFALYCVYVAWGGITITEEVEHWLTSVVVPGNSAMLDVFFDAALF